MDRAIYRWLKKDEKLSKIIIRNGIITSIEKYSREGKRETKLGARMKIKCIHWSSILTKIGALEY